MKIGNAIGIALILAGASFTSASQAACTVPVGTYVGNAAGQAIQPDVSGVGVGPGINFANISWSFTFTIDTSGNTGGTFLSIGKADNIPVPEYGLAMAGPKAGSITFQNWHPINYHTIFSSGSVTSFIVSTTSPQPFPPPVNSFSTITCVGIISGTGTTTIDGSTLPQTPVQWIITVSGDGSTITLGESSLSVNLPAFTILLRRV
ncbi:hypothetical protein [Methylocystis echinoides]|uniref:PEP-CTERM sorting domain-containing protein n=1 Tax=Methylocystis echinoides TaxID=29468 RepID=A0A9W6GXI3_9HYPH|nr:hypothetical protein [Methylocystis echinoides]GLI94977.1 hypothetical protein LMG27198_39690 [Methylocystis echinoides]